MSTHPLRRLKDPFSPAAQALFTNVDWPVPGGRGVDLIRPDDWSRPDITSQFTQGVRVKIGILAGDGLHALAKTLHAPLYKITTTCDESEDLATRRRHLGRAGYAAYWRDGTIWRKDEGFDRWEIKYLSPDVPVIPGSPIQVTNRAIIAHLPPVLPPRAFDAALRRRLETCALHTFIDSLNGQRQCTLLGLDPAMFRRFTAYDYASDTFSATPAHELYVLKPTTHATRLVAIIEQIIRNAAEAAVPAPSS